MSRIFMFLTPFLLSLFLSGVSQRSNFSRKICYDLKYVFIILLNLCTLYLLWGSGMFAILTFLGVRPYALAAPSNVSSLMFCWHCSLFIIKDVFSPFIDLWFLTPHICCIHSSRHPWPFLHISFLLFSFFCVTLQSSPFTISPSDIFYPPIRWNYAICLSGTFDKFHIVLSFPSLSLYLANQYKYFSHYLQPKN